jgi:hypothetical protein
MDSISYETGYFSMGHSSRFVDPGSQRIDTNTFDDDVENVAYQNLDKTIVVVISNRTPTQRNIKIKWNFKSFQYNLPGLSAVTFKWDGSASDESDKIGAGGEVLPSDQFVYIRTRANNKYLTVYTAGNLIAAATSKATAEKFKIVPITTSQIAIKSVSRNKFINADDNGNKALIANRDSVLEWECFDLINLPDGTKG